MAVILQTDQHSLETAAQALKEGKLVAIPTETVYGLGGNALLPKTVARIFEVKGRPSFDPLIVHVAEKKDVEKYCFDVPQKAWKLIDHFWPGPLTLVLPKKEIIPDIVSGGLSTVAIRMPSHPVARSIIRMAGVPVAAPSANLFSKLSPTRAEHVLKQIGENIDYIVDGGQTPIGVESTVVFVSGDEITILRPGGVSLEDVTRVAGPVTVAARNEKVLSPGQLELHYSPHTPLRVIDRNSDLDSYSSNCGYLAFREPPERHFREVRILSPGGDLREAAANLFLYLHQLDEAGVELILTETIPETGLGRAIMDRLRKAARK